MHSLTLLAQKRQQDIDKNSRRLSFRDRIIFYIAQKRGLYEKYDNKEELDMEEQVKKNIKKVKKKPSINSSPTSESKISKEGKMKR